MDLKNRLAYYARLSKETKTQELSDILEDEGVVRKERVHTARNSFLGVPFDKVTMGFGMYDDIDPNDLYLVNFSGPGFSITVENPVLFNEYEDRELVRVGYRNGQRVTYDFIPPDFDKKFPVDVENIQVLEYAEHLPGR